MKITAEQFTSIMLGAFGAEIKDSIVVGGQGGNCMVAVIPPSCKNMAYQDLFIKIKEAGSAIGLDLAPSDCTGVYGRVDARGGGEDVLAIKIASNDYHAENAQYEQTGLIEADLYVGLETDRIVA